MQIKVSSSALRGFWWLIDLACATGWRGLSVWRRAAGTKSEEELKAPWRQTPHGRAATSCPPKLDDASVVTDWQQKLINQIQVVALAAALVITSPAMSHMAHLVSTATNWTSIFLYTQSVLIKPIFIFFFCTIKLLLQTRKKITQTHTSPEDRQQWRNIQRPTWLEFRWDVCAAESVRIICVSLEFCV